MSKTRRVTIKAELLYSHDLVHDGEADIEASFRATIEALNKAMSQAIEESNGMLYLCEPEWKREDVFED